MFFLRRFFVVLLLKISINYLGVDYMQQFDSFAQMQRDAERRVMEMQRRAMAAVEKDEPKPPCECIEKRPPVKPDKSKECFDKPNPRSHILPGFDLSGEDSERALLIVIILLLLREDADERLILALLYILL